MVNVFDHLVDDVTKPGYCIGCSACVATCPVQCLEYKDEIPVLARACINCGICYNQCPEVIDPKTLQRPIFGDVPQDELLGTYTQALSIEAKDAAMKAHGQDGGAVTALLSSLLDDGYIDGAVVVGTREAPWLPVARVATTAEELVECAGSKYSKAPVFLGLREAVDFYYHKSVAIVGTPCNILASWRMKFSEPTNRHLGEAIKLRVGLFCGGVFGYKEFFKGVVERQLRTPLVEVAKFDIEGGNFVIYLRRRAKREFPMSAVSRHIILPCRVCQDFTAELADISVGSAGSPSGCSTMLVRTPTGAEAFNVAEKFRKFSAVELEKVKPGISEVRREAEGKRSRASRELEILRRQNKPLPIWLQERPSEPPKESIELLKGVSPV